MASSNDAAFAGTHTWKGVTFDVFWFAHITKGEGWYWWRLKDCEPKGPFPTAEGAYLSAIGD